MPSALHTRSFTPFDTRLIIPLESTLSRLVLLSHNSAILLVLVASLLEDEVAVAGGDFSLLIVNR